MKFPLPSFDIARLPRIEFGSGTIRRVPELAASYGRHALVLTGRKSFVDRQNWIELKADFKKAGIAVTHMTRSAGEPTPEQVDEKVLSLKDEKIDVVIGIGGGSALDEAKAIAGLLGPRNSVMDHLEGVGPELEYEGPATPFIAVPTTAGTGSEATKNAVLSRHGPDGFKKSFRHDRLVAEWAVVDPDLLISCPPGVIAGNGMDAFTQLLESYVSTRANPFTDALAMRGIKSVREGLVPLYEQRGDDGQARSHMALASLLSGICLAQTGLGSVHGLASPLGAFFPIPHGICCGTLVASATKVNIRALASRTGEDNPALVKYAEVGLMLIDNRYANINSSIDSLEATLDNWTKRLELPRLSHFGVTKEDFPRIIENISPSSMRTNPVVLKNSEVEKILQSRL